MARKTFISYKYSEAIELREKIISALEEDATYYNGETADSPDLTDSDTETIKKNLRNMIYDTSVLILIISPNMLESKWIDWEIEYSLKEISRSGRTSKTNGVVGVVMEVNGSYDWFIKNTTDYHGNWAITFETSKVYPIIYGNLFNSNPAIWHCNDCKVFDSDKGSYISIVKEEDFLMNPSLYIERAYEKSTETENYDLKKQK